MHSTCSLSLVLLQLCDRGLSHVAVHEYIVAMFSVWPAGFPWQEVVTDIHAAHTAVELNLAYAARINIHSMSSNTPQAAYSSICVHDPLPEHVAQTAV